MRQRILFIAALLCVLLCVAARAEVSISTGKGSPVIDGTVDDLWDGAKAVSANAENDYMPLAGSYLKFLWDSEHLYFLASINDSTLSPAALSSPALSEGIEIYCGKLNAALHICSDGEKFSGISDGVWWSVSYNPRGYIVEGAISGVYVDGEEVSVFLTVFDDTDSDGVSDFTTGWGSAAAKKTLLLSQSYQPQTRGRGSWAWQIAYIIIILLILAAAAFWAVLKFHRSKKSGGQK